MPRTRKELKQELKKITDTVDIDFTNNVLAMSSDEFKHLQITKTTLTNIANWALNGSSQLEIRQNLELNQKEWEYLIKVCPTILLVMQHSQAYAEIVIAGSLYQTAIGGHTIHRKQPIKIKDYDENGKVIGEHIEYAEWDEEQPSNPNLLKYLAEHKLGEQFGEVKTDSSKEQRKVIDSLSPEELAILDKMSKEHENKQK